MDNWIGCDTELKLNIEADNQICRCCLATGRRVKRAALYQQCFTDLAGINVCVSDGVPQWVCYECGALMLKAHRFKMKMVRAHTMLYEYLARCAPFPIEPSDPELSRYAAPHLDAAPTLAFDSAKSKSGFHKVLQIEKRPAKSLEHYSCVPTHAVNVAQLGPEDARDVKHEVTFSDMDDVPLEDYRSQNNEEEPPVTVKKKKKKKETRTRKSKITNSCKEVKSEIVPKKCHIRKPVEIDPDKIRVITLNPEEQCRQREAESKATVQFPYQCALCYKGFNFESKLQNHMAKHSPSRGQYECKLCSMFLPTVYSHSVHMLIHTRRYECVKCECRMIDRASILHHYKTQHEGITTVITCDLCGKVSSNNKTHRGHLRNHHSGERPKCDQCGKTFVNKDSLTEHMQIHEGVKNYECSVCGKRCRTRNQMRSHQLTHTSAKEFYCVECDVRFKSANSLRQHLTKSLKHKDVNTLVFPCEHCDKRFDSTLARQMHVRVQHDGVRAWPCAVCGAALASRASRDKHARRHRAPAPPPARHVCDTCGKAFRGKSVLTNHLRTHTGEKPFECAVCGRAFSQRTARATHVKLVHLKIRRNKAIKDETPHEPKPDLLKNEPQVVYDAWNRPYDVFHVTAGP